MEDQNIIEIEENDDPTLYRDIEFNNMLRRIGEKTFNKSIVRKVKHIKYIQPVTRMKKLRW